MTGSCMAASKSADNGSVVWTRDFPSSAAETAAEAEGTSSLTGPRVTCRWRSTGMPVAVALIKYQGMISDVLDYASRKT